MWYLLARGAYSSGVIFRVSENAGTFVGLRVLMRLPIERRTAMTFSSFVVR
jgi:hypothetical protein